MILCLNKNILKRFEHHLKGGVLILWNTENDEYWLGNKAADDLIRLIDGHRSLDEIYNILLPAFQKYDLNETIQNFNKVIHELLAQKYLTEVNHGDGAFGL